MSILTFLEASPIIKRVQTEVSALFALKNTILRLIQNTHCQPIKREVAGDVASDIHDANTKIRVAEVAACPCTAPRVGCAAEQVCGFTRCQGWRGLDCCPCPAAVP